MRSRSSSPLTRALGQRLKLIAREPLLRWIAQHDDRVLYVSVRAGRVEVHDMLGFATPRRQDTPR